MSKCLAIAFAAAATVGISSCASPGASPREPEVPPAPAASFASAADAEAALLELEDRRAFDAATLRGAAASSLDEVRERVALAVGRIRDERGRELLAALLADRSARVRSAAAFGCLVLGDPTLTAELIPLLSDPDRSVVQSAAKAIGFLGRGDGQDALVAAIPGAAAPEPRATLLRSLWRFALPATEAAALPYAADPDPRVRSAALYTLSRKPQEGSLAALTAALGDADADTAAAAARALGILGFKESIGPLAAALDSGRLPLQIEALNALEAILEKTPGASLAKDRRDRVLAFAGEANPNLALPALILLRQFAGSEREVLRRLWSIATTGEGRRRQVALLSVVAALRDRAGKAIEGAMAAAAPAPRAAAAESLVHLPPEQARSLRSKLWSDREPVVRAATLTSLRTAEAVRGNRAFVEAALADPDPGVRGAAIDALVLLGEPAALPLLRDAVIKSYPDPSPDVAITAVSAAEKLRGDAGARTVVEAAYRHPRVLIQRMAARALRRSFGADGAAAPIPEYKPGKSRADYRAILDEAKRAWEARIETARGVFVVRLSGSAAPLTVVNFLSLARKGYFDGTTLHRVVPNFVIQGGDPTATGSGGPGYEIRDEINSLPYREGTVGMALSGPDTGGSQWFATHAPEPHLDGIYTVFGQVTSGQDVVERIEQGDRVVRVTVSAAP
jgi:cyclophilin family peptidyl-prolyl cis-trans isomerase